MKNKKFIPYLSCPICGMSKPASVVPQNFKTDPLDWLVVEIRENRGGRGKGGFFLVGGFTVGAALKCSDPEIQKVAKLQLDKIRGLVKRYLDAGWLNLSDFEKGS